MSKSNIGETKIHLPFYLNVLDFKNTPVIIHKHYWVSLFFLKFVYNIEKKYITELHTSNTENISNKILFSIYVEKKNEIIRINLTKIIYLLILDLVKYPVFRQNNNVPLYNFRMSNLIIQSIKYKIEDLI